MIVPQNKPILLPNGILSFKPKKTTTHFGFAINYQQAKLQMSCEIALTFLGIENLNFAKYRLARTSIRIDNQIPDSIVYEMAMEMANAIYPVEFTIDQNLDCVSLNNHKAIVERCKTASEKMASYYQGEMAQKLLANFEQTYSSAANLMHHIQNDVTFRILSFPIYKAYTFLLKTNVNYKWTENNHVFDMDLEHTIDPNYNSNGKLVLHTKNKKPKGKTIRDKVVFEATFHLNQKTHTFAMAKGTLQYPLDSEQETLAFELYELAN